MPRSILTVAILLAACAAPPAPPPASAPAPAPAAPPVVPASSLEILRRADADRLRALELELERLRADLQTAEQTLLAVESGLKTAPTRAEAVSAVAEARIEVERAMRRAPWRAPEAAEAEEKLAEANRQLAAGNVGSAVFFAARAKRVADALIAEAIRFESDPALRFVQGSAVNLRAGPSVQAPVLEALHAPLPVFVEQRDGDWSLVRTVSGRVGFVHSGLLRRP